MVGTFLASKDPITVCVVDLEIMYGRKIVASSWGF